MTHLGSPTRIGCAWPAGRSPCPPASASRVHQHLPHCWPGTGIGIHSVHNRSRLPIDPEAGDDLRRPASPLPQPRAQNPRRYVDGHSALSVVARSHCTSHPFLRSVRLMLAEHQSREFAVVRISISGGTATAPTRGIGRRWRHRTFVPRRRHMPIAQTDIISGCISDLKGVRRSGGALRRYRHSGLAAVMQRASPRGVLPQGIRTERKRPSWVPG
jgi:hypothetical protein